MSTFIYFAGFILLILVLKFVYDSYLTDNTEREWERYKSDFPDKARRMEGKDNERSYLKKIKESIAKDLKCEIYQVEEKYIEAIQEDGTLLLPASVFNSLFKDEIRIESQNQRIKENETRAYLLYSWAKKVFIPSERIDFNGHKYQEMEQRFYKFFTKNGAEFIDFFKSNPDIYDLFVQKHDEVIDSGDRMGNLVYTVLLLHLAKNEERHDEKVRDNLISIGLKWSDRASSRANFVLLYVDNELYKMELGISPSNIQNLDNLVEESIEELNHEDINDVQILVILYKQSSRIKEILSDENGALLARVNHADYREKYEKMVQESHD